VRVQLLLEVDGDDDDLWPDDDEPLQPAMAALHAAILGTFPMETLDDTNTWKKKKKLD